MKLKEQENLKYLRRKETKAKPHIENTKWKASAAGKVNWNWRHLHEKESKESNIQHSGISKWSKNKESRFAVIEEMTGNACTRWHLEPSGNALKSNKLNTWQHMEHGHNSNFQCPVFYETNHKKKHQVHWNEQQYMACMTQKIIRAWWITSEKILCTCQQKKQWMISLFLSRLG